MKSRRSLLQALLVATLVVGTANASARAASGRIAFTSNRDTNDEIYTMKADGSNRVNLTRDPASDVDPRYSPNGSKIVFSSNRGGEYAIYTMDSDGANVQLVTQAQPNERRPSFVDDGRIVFQAGFFPNRAIDAVNIDGTGLTTLTPPGFDSAWAAPAPHGTRIAFSRFDGATQRLMTMNESGGDVRAVTSPSAGASDYQANWSPTGNDLTFIRNDAAGATDVYVVHKNGESLRQITATANRIESEPNWSPDGRRVAFHGCTEPNTNNQHCAIYTIGADGTDETDISTPHAPLLETFKSDIRDPIWHTIQFGTGTSFVQRKGRLEITLGADAQPGPPFNEIEAHYGLNCSLPGDFDIQAEYKLLEWPSANGAFAQLAAFFASAGIFRQSAAWGEFYNANSGSVFNTAPTADTVGAFRLVRSTGELIAYYLDPILGWVKLLDAPAAADVVVPGLSVSSFAFGHQEVKVAFDNFRLNSGALSCPTWWDDSAPDWQRSDDPRDR